MKTFKIAKELLVGGITFTLIGSAHAFYMGFEEGVGKDKQNIVGVPGVTFSTTAGQTWQYSDTLNGSYNHHSIDLNYGNGAYHHYGNGVAWLGIYGNSGRIDFNDKNGSWFQTGYCSASTFTVEAYNSLNQLIDSATGGGNLNSFGYLRVDAPVGQSIAYLMMHDSGNYWIVDEMTGDMAGGMPVVPEPTTMVTGALLLLPLGASVLRKLRKNRTA